MEYETSAQDFWAAVQADTRLRRVAATWGGEYAGPCPFCGGTDRFRVWPDHPSGGGRWWCRQCQRSGDAVAYLVERGDISPHTAGRLRHSAEFSAPARPAAGDLAGPAPAAQPPAAAWQARARQFVAYAEAQLWEGDGQSLYELHRWGLSNETIKTWQLGWNPRDLDDQPERWGLTGKPIYLPCGITIPHDAGGQLWTVKIRRYRHGQPANEPKYLQPRHTDEPASAAPRDSLFGVDRLRGHSQLLLLTEGEKDGLLAWQELGAWVDVASLGGAAKGLPTRWLSYLLPYRRILLIYDADDAGQQGALRLSALVGRCLPLSLPQGHDLVDFVQQGGELRPWLQFQLVRLGLWELANRGPAMP